MKFTTPIPVSRWSTTIDYQSEIVLLGSCFAENIGNQLAYFQFQHLVNPFGILFHPLALARLIDRTVSAQNFTAADFFYYNERWFCFELHSDWSHEDLDELVVKSNLQLHEFKKYLERCSHLFLTLGTSWVYRHRETNEIVANCHKVPQHHFSKELLSSATIVTHLQQTAQQLIALNPALQLVYTVSPVRHIKDGFFENNVSKAHLLAAVYQLIGSMPGVTYFPAYEIVMDELRDYRFYKSDMLHPNDLAIAYIFERFTESFIAPSSQALMLRVADIQKALQHRPFSTNTKQYQQFVAATQSKINALQLEIPHLSFS